MPRRVVPPCLALVFVTCAHNTPQGAITPTPAHTVSEAPSGGAATEDELTALVSEVLTPQLCPRLRGSWLGLPGEGDVRGPAAGTLPSVGRWWIRTCEARRQGDRIELTMGGQGWTWVDRESSGFRVRQYLLFDAEASLGADVRVGYDRARRVASLWMIPAPGVTARITPRGVVTAEPTGFFASVLGTVAQVAGSSVDERARTQAAELGSERLRDRLATGITMTFSMATQQADFMVGSLERGQVPERPFPSDAPWLVNQRSMVWPGGLDVIGPVDVSAPRTLEVALEEGDGAVLRTVCEEALGRYVDARFRDPTGTPRAPSGGALVELGPGRELRTVTVPAGTCPTLLLLSSSQAGPARVRYRVLSNPTTGAAQEPARPRAVRVLLVGARVRPTNPSGRDWDLVGGEADVQVTVTSLGHPRTVDRTTVFENNNNPTFNRWLPGPLDLAEDLPLRFTVTDDDSTSQEPIGQADLAAAQVPSQGGEVTLALRAAGATGEPVGSLTLRLQALAR
ncbi:MAG: hypothetical protein HY909_15435 [Deltaproteobacteria bacterium]|nr:hypothetical protein [Deltaproteobacteria bacterium]